MAPLNSKKLSLAVVIIGLNEADHLELCFESLWAALSRTKHLIGAISVVYVDSGSTDSSVQIAFQHASIVLRLSSKPSAAAARQAGAAFTESDLILFLDGDMEIYEDWLVKALSSNVILDNSVAGVIGTRDDMYLSDNNQVTSIRRNVYGTEKAGRTYHLGGAALLKRCALVAAGGYNPCLEFGEEPDLYARLISSKKFVIALPFEFVKHFTPSKPSILVRLRKILTKPDFTTSLLISIKQGYFFGFIYVYRYRFASFLMHSMALFSLTLGVKLFALLLETLLLLLLIKNKRTTECFIAPAQFVAVVLQANRAWKIVRCCRREVTTEVLKCE